MNKYSVNTVLFFAIVLGLLFFQGCGNKNSLGTIKVSGTVTLDGEFVGGATVAFYPKSPDGRECFGITDAQGQFVLTVSGAEMGSGAMPGEYCVAITKKKSQGTSNSLTPETPMGPPPPPVHLLPEKYASRTTTDITPVKVEKGKKNVFTFELFSK